jgi:hypothetical protein
MARITIKRFFGAAPNQLLNNPNVSFKAKGLYAFINSKPQDWDFSVESIANQNKEGKDAIRVAIKELETNGYLVRQKFKDSLGQFHTEYLLIENPTTENPTTENPDGGKPIQSYKKESTKKELTKRIKEIKDFVAPSYEEVKAYYIEQGASLHNLDKCFAYYTDADWLNRDGKKVKDWKRTIKTNWLSKTNPQASTNGSSYNSQLPVDASQIVNYGKGNGKVFFDKKAGLWYEPLTNGYLPKEISDYYYYDQGNHSNYGDYVRWMIENDKNPMPPEDTRYFPADWNFEKYVLEQRAIVASSNL